MDDAQVKFVNQLKCDVALYLQFTTCYKDWSVRLYLMRYHVVHVSNSLQSIKEVSIPQVTSACPNKVPEDTSGNKGSVDNGLSGAQSLIYAGGDTKGRTIETRTLPIESEVN